VKESPEEEEKAWQEEFEAGMSEEDKETMESTGNAAKEKRKKELSHFCAH